LVLENIDELFDREELSAVRDPGWPDCFNSGVFVFTPNEATFLSLVKFATTTGSYDGGDQGLLNSFFGDWGFGNMSRHLPYTYNCCSVTFYSYLPALKQFASKVKVVHFIGADKPWTRPGPPKDTSGAASEGTSGLPNFQQLWWNQFRESIEDKLKGLDLNLHSGGHLASSSYHGTSSSSQFFTSGIARATGNDGGVSADRQHAWETGHVDYRGVDRSDNIMAKIKSTVGAADTTSTFPSTTPTGHSSPVAEDKKSPTGAATKKK